MRYNHRRRNKPHKKGAPAWMVTFSDLMSLILVFFILLFSMSQIDVEKFRALANSFNDTAVFDYSPSVVPMENKMDQGQNQGIPNTVDKEPAESKESEQQKLGELDQADSDKSLSHLLEEVQSYLKESEISNSITAIREERGVVLVLDEQVLFETGEARIIAQAKPFLNKVGDLLNRVPNIVKVEGHTDNRPISTAKFPSNWELSGARASSVIRYFIGRHNLEPERFISVGYSDTRPIAPNTTSANLQKNRRVEIVISDPYFMGRENKN